MYQVTKVSVTELVGSTYHARVYWTAPAASSLAAKEQSGELNIDARPSDAINFAVRFGAPIYVARAVSSQSIATAGWFSRLSRADPQMELLATSIVCPIVLRFVRNNSRSCWAQSTT